MPPLRQPQVGSFFFFGFAAMPARKIRIVCLLAGVFVLSILDYRDTALARPAHQVSREGKSQSQSKSEKVEGARPRASGRGTDAATSSQTPPHLDSKQNPVGATRIACTEQRLVRLVLDYRCRVRSGADVAFTGRLSFGSMHPTLMMKFFAQLLSR